MTIDIVAFFCSYIFPEVGCLSLDRATSQILSYIEVPWLSLVDDY